MKISRTIILISITSALILGGLYLGFFKESPAAQYLRTSCEAIKSSPVSKGIDSNKKLLAKLIFNLGLAEKADEKETFNLSQYVDELREYVKIEKEISDAQLRKFQYDLALGILGDKNTDDIIDDAIDDALEGLQDRTQENLQKQKSLKNNYFKTCDKWIATK
jgi:hypothetical protein